MQRLLCFIVAWLLAAAAVCVLASNPLYIVMSGPGGETHQENYSEYNRIEFDGTRFLLSASDGSVEVKPFNYPTFTRVAFSRVSGVESAVSGSGLSISYVTGMLCVGGVDDVSDCDVRVYDLSGHALLVACPDYDGRVSVETLAPGLYIAVASDNRDVARIKFIVR